MTLSDELINKLLEKHCYAPMPSAFALCRAIEAAVLEAQKEQGPVAIVGLQHQTDMLWGAKVIPAEEPQKFAQFLKDMPVGTPLYAAPVVQPDMVMVPREPTETIVKAMEQQWMCGSQIGGEEDTGAHDEAEYYAELNRGYAKDRI